MLASEGIPLPLSPLGQPLRSLMVDARMVGYSGIGTYLQNLLPRLIVRNPEIGFTLIGGPDLFVHDWARAPQVGRIESLAPPYSIHEQVAALSRRPAGTDLFWSPHYNVPLLHRGKLLVTLHDLAHLAVPELLKGSHRKAYSRLLFRATARATARVFDSRFTAAEYSRFMGTPGKRDEVIYPGVDEVWFSLQKGNSPHPRPYLLFVGNVKPHKNLRGLLRAFGMLSSEISHDLVVVGRKERFIHGDPAAIEGAGRLGRRVSFTGWVDDELIRRYFVHADALVFPSFYEGFGLPPLEAMACGCPTIVSRAASLPEVCGDATLYCDPASPADIAAQIRTLLRNAPLREELIDRGKTRARGFSWNRCADETTGVMRSLLEI
jgi:glycosyltransferase involved in cell wall biosynthesis